jgi:hypothetical protein
MGHAWRSLCEIRPEFADRVFENVPEAPTKSTRALADRYNLLILNNLFGGEGGDSALPGRLAPHCNGVRPAARRSIALHQATMRSQERRGRAEKWRTKMRAFCVTRQRGQLLTQREVLEGATARCPRPSNPINRRNTTSAVSMR